MKTIPLTRGKYAIVDDEDFDRLNRHKWQAVTMKFKESEVWYARRMTSLKDGPRKAVFMHREVTGAVMPMVVNHRDFDGLNNQKSNLDVTSYSANARWKRKAPGTSSRFKGVTWNKSEGRWMTTIRFGGGSRTLGYFDDEEEAALMYDVAAQILFGDEAFINGV